jgi:hypothetical protein
VSKSQDTSGNCVTFKNLSVSKIKKLDSEIKKYNEGIYLSRTDLMKIILPEYVTYNPIRNDIEIAFIKFCTLNNIQRFNSISFGPFQMQLQFIKNVLENIPMQNINDTVLLNCKNSGYDVLLDNITYLNRSDIQWKLLVYFESINSHLYNSSKSIYLNKLIDIYNSGKIEHSSSKTYFTKINCERKTYVEWCYELYDWVDENKKGNY